MRAVVIYESIYGNTHLVAAAIAEGLGDAVAVPVGEADRAMVEAAELVVIGGPTHAHAMSSAGSRQAGIDAAEQHDDEVDPDAEGPGLRDWFTTLEPFARPAAAAFDTRMHGPAALTGRASKGIARRLRHHGFTMIGEPESFLVTKDNHLEMDERARARAWGASLAAALASVATASPGVAARS